MRWTKYSVSLLALLMGIVLLAPANADANGKHRHGPKAPYLTSAQLTSLAALNLTQPQWHCFWKGVVSAQFKAAKAQVDVASGEKPTPSQRKAFHEAMKAAFGASFTAQLAVAPTDSCPRVKASPESGSAD